MAPRHVPPRRRTRALPQRGRTGDASPESRVERLQRTSGNRATSRIVGPSSNRHGVSPAVSGVVQRKHIDTVRQELRLGGYVNNFAKNFLRNHIGITAHDMVSAAQMHSTRVNANGTLDNTVIKDARRLKDELVAGVWTDQGDHWSVRTAQAVDMVTTRKTAGAFGAVPTFTAVTATYNEPDDFTIAGGEVTAMTGVTDQELAAAKLVAGRYPSGRNTKPAKRRAYREKLIDAVNNARRAEHADATALWVRTNIARIGGTDLTGVNAATVGDINAFAFASQQVTVFIGKDTGNIYHYQM